MNDKDALDDIEHTFYDVFHSMSQPSTRGKNWGHLLEYAKAQLMPKIRALQSRTTPSDVSSIIAYWEKHRNLSISDIETLIKAAGQQGPERTEDDFLAIALSNLPKDVVLYKQGALAAIRNFATEGIIKVKS